MSEPKQGGAKGISHTEFDLIADEYEAQHRANIAITGESPDYFAAYKIAELARFATELAVPPRRLLDFGSGIGNSIPHFRQYFPDAQLTCADASERSMQLSRQRVPGPETYSLVVGQSLDLPDDHFDATFSACVFHHIPHEQHVQWLGELCRVTRPGGLLAIFEHNPLNPLTVRAVNTCPFDKNARLLRSPKLIRDAHAAGWARARSCFHIFFPRALAALRPIEPALGWLPLGGQYSVRAWKS